ncbi:MAG TPA: AMP-binding protein [Burkholderiales bacterium]|nr:AMP-binding protein [Burkholderiales bacterium]
MVFAWHRGAAVSVDAFEAAARALAARLPQQPYAVNLCEDRYAFTLAFAACLLARQTTLLPPSRAPEAVNDSCAGRDSYRLTDDEVLAPANAQGRGGPIVVDAGHVAAIVFTSGSTGRPVGHAKTWGSLVAGARALGARLGASGSVIGTIPPQHMFGLESTVMLPWQNGLAVHSGRPLLPADLGEASAALPAPSWLMTSPLHLRACVGARQALPGLAGVVSSTMPLDPRLARDAERLWSVPVFEIYGSSEAGMIALRRTALDEAWELCPGVTLEERDGALWVQGGHIAEAQRVADRLERRGERHFTLHGRKSGLVKIAGKRTSLDALNAVLARIEGVQDGVFYQRDGAARLGALVVAPGRGAQALRAALREHIDPAFLPRPLHLVAALPRNETGKLTRQALLELVAALEARDTTPLTP